MSKHTQKPLVLIPLALLAFWQLGGLSPDALRAQSTRTESAQQSTPSRLGNPQDVIVAPPGMTRPTGRAQLNGMIVATDSGNPVVGALVIASGSWEYRTTTDAGGWYRFTDLPAGTYGMIVGKTGYMVSAALRDNAELPLTAALRQLRDVEVTEGQPARVDFRMMRAGAVSGVVRDEQGEPIEGVYVSLIVPSYRDQTFRLQAILSTRTDDAGRYRLDNLDHREYYLEARVLRNAVFAQRHGAGVVYPPTFFPAATDFAAAQRVSLSETLPEARGDFSLIATSAAEITGLAVNSRGEPLADQTLVVEHPLLPARADIRTRIGPDGRFRIEAVPPGISVLAVQANCCGSDKQEFGYAVVTSAPASTTDVRIVTQPEILVSGRIVRSTGAPVGASMRVRAIPVDLPRVPGATGVVAADGTFELRMHPVVSRIEISGLEPGWYASLTGTRRQPSGQEIDGRAGTAIRDVLITLSNRVAHLRGVVTQAGGGGNDRILVAVFSMDPQQDAMSGTRYTASAHADVNGQFEFSGLAPGDYTVVAVRGLAPMDLQDPAFRASVRTDGTMVSLREADSKSITMRIANITRRPCPCLAVAASRPEQSDLTLGAIRGTVLDAASGALLRSASVHLISRDGTVQRLAVSDAGGEFEFPAVPPGQFEFHAEKTGYLQTRDDGFPVESIRLQAGQSVKGVKVSLTPASAISGVIRDKNGEPLNNVQVRALKLTDEAGQPPLNLAPTPARTDSNGRFRIPNLAAGRYYVEARPTGSLQTGIPGGSILLYAPTYYPGALTPSEASQVLIETAGTVEIDMRLAFAPMVQLEGTAHDATGRPLSGGQPLSAVVEVLQPVGTLLVHVANAFIDAEGSFRVGNLAAGTYVLRTRTNTSGPVGQQLSASMTVAATADRSGIALVAQPMARLVGRIHADGLPRGAFLPPLRVGVLSAVVGEPAPSTFGNGVVNPDMTFLLATSSGPARIGVANLPPGWAVETITIDGVDATDAPTQLHAGREHVVTLTLKRR